MKFKGVAATVGIVAALVVVSGGALVGAHVAVASATGASNPTPILGPITPAAFPYNQLAILRRQRFSTDVLPAGISGGISDEMKLIPASARLLATEGDDKTWIVANTDSGVCLLSAFASGSSSVCTDSGDAVKPGTEILAGGNDTGLLMTIVADGAPVAGAVGPSYRQVAPNVWMKKSSHATVASAPSAAGDPLAFPRVKPYSQLAILNRAATPSDTEPANWHPADGSTSVIDSAVVSSLRRAGTYRGTTAWVSASSDGGACLILADASGPGLSTCGALTSPGGVAAGAGNNDDGGTFQLVPDKHDTAKSIGPGAIRLAPNVWVVPPDEVAVPPLPSPPGAGCAGCVGCVGCAA